MLDRLRRAPRQIELLRGHSYVSVSRENLKFPSRRPFRGSELLRLRTNFGDGWDARSRVQAVACEGNRVALFVNDVVKETAVRMALDAFYLEYFVKALGG